jgi:hypothetical protein
VGSDNLTSADDQQVGRLFVAYLNDHNESPVEFRRVMVWSELHGDMQIEAEMASRRQFRPWTRWLSVRFMDDGLRKSSQCRGAYLNTQSFTSAEVELLRSAIRRDVGVDTTVRQQSDGLQIYVPSSSKTEMVAFIDEEMLPSMRYKLPD